MILKGSLGLGDAIYLWPAVKYYVDKGEDVSIVTRYPEIYDNLNCKTIAPDEFIDCSCSARTKEKDTNIFEDTCYMAEVPVTTPFIFDFKSIYSLIRTDKIICVVRNITAPVKADPSSEVMIPKVKVFQQIIDVFKNRCYFVAIGQQKGCDYKLKNIDMNLSQLNNLKQYISVINSADIVLTQPGHCVPIAEALNKKLFCVFAKAGLESMEKRYRFTTPEKILTKKTSSYCVDDDEEQFCLAQFQALLEE